MSTAANYNDDSVYPEVDFSDNFIQATRDRVKSLAERCSRGRNRPVRPTLRDAFSWPNKVGKVCSGVGEKTSFFSWVDACYETLTKFSVEKTVVGNRSSSSSSAVAAAAAAASTRRWKRIRELNSAPITYERLRDFAGRMRDAFSDDGDYCPTDPVMQFVRTLCDVCEWLLSSSAAPAPAHWQHVARTGGKGDGERPRRSVYTVKFRRTDGPLAWAVEFAYVACRLLSEHGLVTSFDFHLLCFVPDVLWFVFDVTENHGVRETHVLEIVRNRVTNSGRVFDERKKRTRELVDSCLAAETASGRTTATTETVHDGTPPLLTVPGMKILGKIPVHGTILPVPPRVVLDPNCSWESVTSAGRNLSAALRAWSNWPGAVSATVAVDTEITDPRPPSPAAPPPPPPLPALAEDVIRGMAAATGGGGAASEGGRGGREEAATDRDLWVENDVKAGAAAAAAAAVDWSDLCGFHFWPLFTPLLSRESRPAWSTDRKRAFLSAVLYHFGAGDALVRFLCSHEEWWEYLPFLDTVRLFSDPTSLPPPPSPPRFRTRVSFPFDDADGWGGCDNSIFRLLPLSPGPNAPLYEIGPGYTITAVATTTATPHPIFLEPNAFLTLLCVRRHRACLQWLLQTSFEHDNEDATRTAVELHPMLDKSRFVWRELCRPPGAELETTPETVLFRALRPVAAEGAELRNAALKAFADESVRYVIDMNVDASIDRPTDRPTEGRVGAT